MLVDNYSVFYAIKEDRVIMTDVLYSASDIEELSNCETRQARSRS